MVKGIISVEGLETRGLCEEKTLEVNHQKTTTILCKNIIAKSRDRLILSCDLCGKEFTYIKCRHYDNKKKRQDNRDLCDTCKIKVTSLQRYGVESPNQCGKIKQKQQKNDISYSNETKDRSRKTRDDEELKKIKLENLRKGPEKNKTHWLQRCREGTLLARKDPNKYKIPPEGRKNNSEATTKMLKKRWQDPEFREKMAKNKWRISKFQLKIYEELVQQDSNWRLEFPIQNTGYTADICNPSTKQIIECFGDFWHCSPTKFDENYYNKLVHKTAKEIWEYDKTRIETLQSLGYTVKIIWEHEVKIKR